MAKYRPLADGLTIKPSKIEGLGLFTLVDIERGVKLGQTHVIDYMTGEIIRTPLGGFINHSETPNCKLAKDGRFSYLYTIKDIKGMTELTVKYELYKP